MNWPQRCYNGVRVMNAPSFRNVQRLDAGVLPMLRSMSNTGMRVDVGALESLDKQLADEQDDLMFQINAYRSEANQLNLNSGKQLAELLFHELGLSDDGLKRVKDNSRAKLGKKATAKLKGAHEVVGLYTQWKERQTLRSMFCQALPKSIHPDGRLHPEILTTRVETGRFAFKHPNLTQMPVRSKLGKQVRNAFRPDPGKIFFSVDESQIELRMVAHLAGDDTMISQFRSGLDLHTQGASIAFNVPFDEVDPDNQRKPMKNCNFGIVYGITPGGLLEQFLTMGLTTWDLSGIEGLVRRWFEIYDEVREFMDLQARRVKAHNYVWDMWGRVRFFPEISSAHSHIREKAVREAGNMPVTASAQGTMKLAMAEIWDNLHLWKDKAPEPLIQLHDELVFQLSPDIAEEFADYCKAVIGSVVELLVPIESDAAWGPEWGSLG